MEEITAIYAMPLWERLIYRFLLIPATRKALQGRRPRFAWTDSGRTGGRGGSIRSTR